MLQSYDDILRSLTHLTRQAHYFHFLWRDLGPKGAHPECTTFSYDLVDDAEKCCCACVASPLWWDENGTPRFEAHHPNLAPNIYATEVALLLISCQSCGRELDVQMSWTREDEIMRFMRAVGAVPDSMSTVTSAVNAASLSSQIQMGTIHYGDPPCDCAAGPTMNCWDLRVREFWDRKSTMEWKRVPDLEVELPDMADPDRKAPVESTP